MNRLVDYDDEEEDVERVAGAGADSAATVNNTGSSEQTEKDKKTRNLLSAKHSAPNVAIDHVDITSVYPKKFASEIDYNVPFDALYKPETGPSVSGGALVAAARPNNHLTGYLTQEAISDFDFERQRLTYDSQGYALNPSLKVISAGTSSGFFSNDPAAYVGDVGKAVSARGKTVAELSKKDTGELKKRRNWGNSEDVDNYQGPWGGYEGETIGSKVGISDDQKVEYQKLMETYGVKRKRRRNRGGQPEEPWMTQGNEKSIFHGKSEKDYMGRSYLAIPNDVDVRLDAEPGGQDCFAPKRCIHTFKGHSKGVNAVRLFPKSGHLLLSASLDGKAKLWDMYHDRSCLRTFMGHSKSIRDCNFNFEGKQFLTASYDKFVKLWDTETGACMNSFQTDHTPFCAKFHPDPDKAHLFLAGYGNKKILQWDTRTGKIVQEYDQHLDAVNSITFIDDNKRFVTTSDDKSIRVWEFDIPVVVKYIAEPHMHSMPAVTASPDGKWVLFQGMDNVLSVYGAQGEKFRMNRKKRFVGHIVAGYACQPCFSADSQFVASGDGDGKLNIWEWKSGRMVGRLKGHEKVVMDCAWHPQEASKVVTCSWDSTIKIWD